MNDLRRTDHRRAPHFSLRELIENLLSHNQSIPDRVTLGRAITLLESLHPSDHALAGELLDQILPHTGKSLRIAITGVPGVGKSTFIDAFGIFLINHDRRVAVLSIDPSSSRTGGSILGDKTRMENLSVNHHAFIRPTASGGCPGGVAAHTREVVLLCEAAGFDVVIVETVGVGQGETRAHELTDYFLLLMQAGGGDELQGVKRGIMELADHILINKADGDGFQPSKRTQETYRAAVRLFPPGPSGWAAPVGICSALEKTGMEEAWRQVKAYERRARANEWFFQNRREQQLHWFRQQVRDRLEDSLFNRKDTREKIQALERSIIDQQISVRRAVSQLFR